MRGRKPRAVPTRPAKLGLDTLALAGAIRSSPNRRRWYNSVDEVVQDGLRELALRIGVDFTAVKSIPKRSLRDTEKDPQAAGRARVEGPHADTPGA